MAVAYAEPTTDDVLTAVDIKALKEADQITFAHMRTQANDAGRIICKRRPTKPSPWATDDEYEILCDSHLMGAFTHACAHVYQTEMWETIARSLRAGDRIALRWECDAHTNGYLSKAGLHGDVLMLLVYRGDKPRPVATFEVASMVAPDGFSRMVRR